MPSLYDDVNPNRDRGMPGLEEAPINPLPDVRAMLDPTVSVPAPAPVTVPDPHAAMVHTPQTQQEKQEVIAAQNVAASQQVPQAAPLGGDPNAQPFYAAAPAAGPQIVREQAGSTVSHFTQLAPGYEKAFKESQALDQQQREIAQRGADEKARLTGAQADNVDAEAKRQDEKAAKLAQLDAESNKARAKAEQGYHDAVKAQKEARGNIKEYWSSQPVWKQVASALLLMVNAKARGAIGLESDALKTYNRISEQDYERKLQMVDMLKDDIAIARTGMADADTARARLKDQLLTRYAAADEAAKSKVEAAMLRQGIPLQQIQSSLAINGLDQASNAKKQEFMAQKNRKVDAQTNIYKDRIVSGTEAGAEKLTADQSKSADQAIRFRGALETIDKLGPLSEKGAKIVKNAALREAYLEKNPGASWLGQKLGQFKPPEEELSGEDKQRYSAMKVATNAALRRDTGANAPAAEVVQKNRELFTQPGDSAEVKAQKARALRDTFNGMLIGAGPAAAQIANGGYGGGQQQPQQSGPVAGRIAIVRDKVTGKQHKVRINADSSMTEVE